MRRLARIAALSCVIAATLPAGLAFAEPADPMCQKNASLDFSGSEILRYMIRVLMFTGAADTDIYARQISKIRPFMVETGLRRAQREWLRLFPITFFRSIIRFRWSGP